MADFFGVWGESSSKKNAMVIVTVAILVVFSLGVYWVLSPRYVVLFDSLEQNDVATISAELDRKGIEYVINDAAIMVPEDILHEARLGIMVTGIPVKGAVGYELFDNSDFGMTEFAQRINYQRALEGELTRTIMALDAVKWSRVHIVMPEKQLFTEKDNGPTASIALFVREGELLTSKQVSGIQRLVAASVGKLDPSDVTVLDQNGVVLNKEKSGSAELADVSERQSLVTEIETHLTNKARDALKVALGTVNGTSDVFVTAELDFDKIIKQTENVVPDADSGNVVKKRQSSSNTSSSGKGGGKSSSSTEIEYKVGSEVKEIVKAPGNIKRLSVALVVSTVHTDESVIELRELIQKVVGFNEGRGDQITVSRAVKRDELNENLPQKTDHLGTPVTVEDATITNIKRSAEAFSLTSTNLDMRVIFTVAILVMLLLAILSYSFGRRRSRPAMLTPEQREALIGDMNVWVSQRRQNA